jgi:hypothetical protein
MRPATAVPWSSSVLADAQVGGSVTAGAGGGGVEMKLKATLAPPNAGCWTSMPPTSRTPTFTVPRFGGNVWWIVFTSSARSRLRAVMSHGVGDGAGLGGGCGSIAYALASVSSSGVQLKLGEMRRMSASQESSRSRSRGRATSARAFSVGTVRLNPGGKSFCRRLRMLLASYGPHFCFP